MPKKYGNLKQLIKQDKDAKQYYSELPDYVKSQMNQRADSVNSFESLRDYAENLLRGDD